MPAKKTRRVRSSSPSARSPGPRRLSSLTLDPKATRAEANMHLHARASLASRANKGSLDLATSSHSSPPPAAPHEAVDWKDIAKKLLTGLKKINQARYDAFDLVTVHTAMVASGNALDTVSSVYDAFLFFFTSIGGTTKDWDALRALLPEATLLGTASLPLNIFDYNTVQPCPERFLTSEHTLVSGLEVLFLDNAPLGTHKDRLDKGSTRIDMSVAEQIAAVDKSKVVVLHGESGSGKTVAAMLSAHCHTSSKTGALCVCVIPNDVGLKEEPNQYPSDATLYKQQFNKRFRRALKTMWNYLTKENNALSGRVTQGHVTILFDEFGSKSEAIRAICGSRAELEQTTRGVLLLDAAVTVQIIVAGTGAHGGTHLPGSQPTTYHVQTVAPAVWETSRPRTGDRNVTQFAVVVCNTVEERESRAANAAWRMVMTNARACGIFLRHLSLLEDKDKRLVSPKLLSDLVAQTAATFKSLNNLDDLYDTQYLGLYYRAVALSLYAPEENPWAERSRDVSLCFGESGMVTDRALRVEATDLPADVTPLQGSQDGNHLLCLPNEYNGQRFYLSEAQIVIAQTVLGLGDRGQSGDGFADLVADLFMHAAVLAPLLKGKKLLRPIEPPKPVPLKWIHTLRLLARLIKSAGASDTVIRARLQDRILPNKPKRGSASGEDKNAIDWASTPAVDAVLLNTDKAAFADLIFKQEQPDAVPIVWLVQIKRYESKVLTATATDAELAKMDPSLINPALETIAGGQCDVKRVIFLRGETPAAFATKPDDALLVHAWDPADDVLATSPALGGLYPFSERDTDLSILARPIPRPPCHAPLRPYPVFEVPVESHCPHAARCLHSYTLFSDGPYS